MVQGQQALQHFRIGQRRGPAVGRKNRLIQLAVGILKPGGALMEEKHGLCFPAG
jgi:hypothetical protein